MITDMVDALGNLSCDSGSLVFTAAFAEAAFELPQSSHHLQEALFRALSPLGLQVENIQQVGAFAGPGNWSLSLSFLSFRAALKVGVTAAEVTFLNPSRGDSDVLKTVFRSLESALNQTLITIDTRHLIFHGHFRLPSGYRSVMTRFSGPSPAGLGELSGSGVGFYFQDPLFSDEASVVLDKSALVQDGLYVQTRCQFASSAFDLDTALNNYAAYLDRVMNLLGLGGRQ